MKGRVSDETIKRATGKVWARWFSILDRAGAADMDHAEIAHLLSTKYIPNGWFAQMVTVEYERALRIRILNKKAPAQS